MLEKKIAFNTDESKEVEKANMFNLIGIEIDLFIYYYYYFFPKFELRETTICMENSYNIPSRNILEFYPVHQIFSIVNYIKILANIYELETT